MAKSLFFAPTSMDSGLTSVCLGMLRALERVGVSVGFYKPFSQTTHRAEARHNDGQDSSVAFARSSSHLAPPDPIPFKEAQHLLNRGKSDYLLERVVGDYQQVAREFDVVVIEGLVPDRTEAYIARLNVEVARNLDSHVILVSSPKNLDAKQLDEELDFSSRLFADPNDPDVIGVILNMIGKPELYGLQPDSGASEANPAPIDYRSQCKVFSEGRFRLLGEIPWQPELLAPRVSDIVRELELPVLSEGNMDARRVQKVNVCARSIRNMIETLKPGTLLVTPGDREEIVITAALAALNGVPLAGLMLTGGFMPDQRVIDLCHRALETGVPVISSSANTYRTAQMLANLSSGIPIDDPERIEKAMEAVATRIDTDWLQQHLRVERQSRLSPPAFRYQLSERARAANKRIVLPEGSEPRTVQAAIICHQRKLARCALIGNAAEIRRITDSQDLELPEDIEIIEPGAVRERYISPMVEIRKSKGLTPDVAEAMLEDNVVLGTMMVVMDEADGLVSGATHTTANTVRPALQLIKTHEQAKVVSSVFFMLLPQQVVVYGDCAINPDPDAEELADIAIQSAESAEAFGIEPRVAMISYSTGESGSGEDVDKVREATRIARERRPDLLIDGPLQYDAAAIESVARSKAPDSKVAGKTTVFVFPDLNTGNTTYKAVQRSANVVSIGPMLQGLRKPVNDLSRGALVEDIVFTIALTAVQAKQVENAGLSKS